VLEKGVMFQLMSAFLLAGGTCFVMWLGEQITEKGMGNGSSLLIFAGIVAYFPQNVGLILTDLSQGKITVVTALVILVLAVALVFGVAFIEQSYRKIPIHYARRTIGKRVMSVQASHLPMKVNMSGVIPAIFASTLLAVPATFVGFGGQRGMNPWLGDLYPNRWLYNVLFGLLVIFFCYFYTSIVFKPDDIAENLKRQNAYIPGIRPGVETSEALDMVVTRLTLAGAAYMNLVCLLPGAGFKNTSDYQFSLGGTSLLIVVGVGLDTVRQVSAQLSTQRYENLMFFGNRSPDRTGPVTIEGEKLT
jgi:preprotein translocase subunit SecY